MAIVKVSELTETTSTQANDELLINDGGVSKKLKVSNFVNAAITANTAKVTNATHSGEVTGATVLTIADDKVDEANLKVGNAPTNGYVLTAQSGNTGGMTWAEIESGNVTTNGLYEMANKIQLIFII